MIKAVFFDLDGTLLPNNEKKFALIYYNELYKKVAQFGITRIKLYKALKKGAKAMIKNDGNILNEDLFWREVVSVLGNEILQHMDILDEFFENEYKRTFRALEYCPYSKKIVDFCRKNGIKTVLATNPIFPKKAVLNRLLYVNLSEEDFDYISTYSNSHFCKPNPKYYEEILRKLNLKPEETIAFGNHKIDDFDSAKKANIKCYLVDYKYEEHKLKGLNLHHAVDIKDVISIIEKESS